MINKIKEFFARHPRLKHWITLGITFIVDCIKDKNAIINTNNDPKDKD